MYLYSRLNGGGGKVLLIFLYVCKFLITKFWENVMQIKSWLSCKTKLKEFHTGSFVCLEGEL